jgi:hypothetical protein
VPIAIVIAVFAFVLGFTALACRLGEWIEDRLGWQPGNAFVATAIGFSCCWRRRCWRDSSTSPRIGAAADVR